MALTQINTSGIKDVTIATADIADDAVTADKLANAINTDIAAKAVLTGSTDNTITTVTGANAIQGEANLTFDGSELKFVGDVLLDDATPTITLKDTNDSDTLGVVSHTSGNLHIKADHNSVVAGSSIRFSVDGAEQARIADGISFNGDSAAGNFLNDYEEGDWTLAFSASGSAAFSGTDFTKGKYVKVGNIVHINFFLYFGGGTAVPSDSTPFRVSLPFATAGNSTNTYSRYVMPAMHMDVDLMADSVGFVGYMTNSSSEMKFYESKDNGTWSDLKNSQVSASGMKMYVSGTYSTI